MEYATVGTSQDDVKIITPSEFGASLAVKNSKIFEHVS